MSTFSEQRQQVLDMATEAQQLARDRGDDAAARDFDTAVREIERGRLSLAVVGEFKRGKSSLLNALIEEPGLFPVDTTVATRMVTTVTYGDTERVTVYLDADPPDELRAEQIDRDRIADYVTEQGNPDNVRRARILTIETPSEKLRDGLTLVDTPGVGGLNSEHTAVTYSYLVNADIVLFVLDASTPLNTEELEFVKTVDQHCAAVIFVVTKIDQVGDYHLVVENTRRKVAAVLERPPHEVAVVPVSSFAKLEYLDSGDEEDLEVSNFQALEAEVWGALRAHGAAIVLLRALGTMARGLDNMALPVTAELEAYERQSQAELEQAQASRTAAAARAAALRSREAAWRKTLERSLKRARHEIVNTRLKTRTLALRYQLGRVLDHEEMLENPEEVVGMIDRDIALLDADVTAAIQERADAVVKRLSAQTGLSLNPAAPDAPLALKAARPDFRLEFEQDGITIDKVEAVQRGLGAGGTIGSVIAYFFATTPVGWLAIAGGTAIAAGAHMARKQLKQLKFRERDARRDAIAERLRPYLDESTSQLEARLVEAIELTEEAIADSFDSMLSAEQIRLEEAQAATDAARARTEEEAAARVSELGEPLGRIKSLRAATDRLAQATLTADRPRSRHVAAVTLDQGEHAGAS